jgi:GNAT superfamily N-acetyltransferase
VRPGVHARPARPQDLAALTELCLVGRREAAVGGQLCTDDADRLRDQLGALIAFPEGRLLVGTLDDQVCGLLIARVVGPGPFTDHAMLNIEAVFVHPDARRRGLGHALLAGAVAAAAEAGASDMFASPLPGSRGMQRFLARVGFAPAASHRVVSVQALQRRLASDAVAAASEPARRVRGRGLEDLIARRRQVRDAGRTVAAAQPRASISMQVSRAVHSRRPSESSTTIS